MDAGYFLDNVQYSKEVKDVYDFADYLEKLRFTTKKNTLTAIIKAYLFPLYVYLGYRAYGITDEEEIIKKVVKEYHNEA